MHKVGASVLPLSGGPVHHCPPADQCRQLTTWFQANETIPNWRFVCSPSSVSSVSKRCCSGDRLCEPLRLHSPVSRQNALANSPAEQVSACNQTLCMIRNGRVRIALILCSPNTFEKNFSNCIVATSFKSRQLFLLIPTSLSRPFRASKRHLN